MSKIKLSAILAAVSLATFMWAAGPHDAITCIGCHSPHYAVDDKIFAVKNTKVRNPLTGESIDDLVASKCLGCHQVQEQGGAGVRPIHLHTTHPLGIKPNPKIADVPDNLLNKGRLDCISCHEPHPSNSNFMYLRVAVGQQGEQLQNFCSTCHSAKADLNAMGVEKGSQMKVFSAMDQSKGSGEFLRDQVVIHNDTQTYVTPLGENQPNDLVPNYQNPPEWTYAPDMSRVNKQPAEPLQQ
jgi:predicted CXXCH cytochrome family protein